MNENTKYTYPSLREIAAPQHNVILDIRYATANNFTGKIVYQNTGCYLHNDAAEKLTTTIRLASDIGYRLKIFDAFRPSEAQQVLWDHTPDPNFLANPANGSPHSRGVAIDLTLVDSDGVELDMGTAFDAFTALSHHSNNEISPLAQRNRFILLGIMTASGWDFYRNEWWHYQLFDSRSYPVIRF